MSTNSAQPTAPATPRRRRWYRAAAPVTVFTLVYFAILVYPALRILTLAFPEWRPGTLELAVLMAGPAAGRLVYEWLPGLPARLLSALTMTWLGVCFIAFCLVLPWELLNALLPLPSRGSGLALLAGTVMTGMVGFINAQRVLVRAIEVAAPQAQRGLVLTQISDVHVGSRSGRFLRRAVRAANTVDADYVFITGDLVDFRHISGDVLAPLATLKAPAYFVIGNHERYVDCAEICARLETLGITVLRNESVRLGDMQLVGIDDAEPKSQVGRVLDTLTPAPGAYRVLLYHRPDGVRDAAAWGIHLMLCGHTHNGQIFPFNYVVRRVFPRLHGRYREGDLQLYVSPGTGTWGPVLRLGSRCEVTAIRLV